MKVFQARIVARKTEPNSRAAAAAAGTEAGANAVKKHPCPGDDDPGTEQMDTSEALETRRKKTEALEAFVASASRSRDEVVDAVHITSTAALEAIAEREQFETRYKDAQKGKATNEVIDRILPFSTLIARLLQPPANTTRQQ